MSYTEDLPITQDGTMCASFKNVRVCVDGDKNVIKAMLPDHGETQLGFKYE